ncbi:TPA: hypothetical protein ACH1MH_000046 [Legionella pneumophila]
MRKVFRLLGIVLSAIVDIADEKPKKRYVSQYGLDEDLDAGLISRAEYNEARTSRHTF